MTDQITITPCRGGLNEEASDIEISAGEVRRSSNYEQIAAGGYRRIGGSVKWGGGPNTPDLTRVTVIETDKLYNYPVGASVTWETIVRGMTAPTSGTHFAELFTIGRENSTLMVIEKDEATQSFVIGEILGEHHPDKHVLAENPEVTEEESRIITDKLTSFGLDVARQPEGNGRIEFLAGLEGQLVCARQGDTYMNFQISTFFGRTGKWLGANSDIVVPDGGVWDSYPFTFAGGKPSLYIANGVSNPIIYEYPATVSEVVVPSVSEFPTHSIVHQNHWFLGYANGSVIHSDLGDPTSFTALGGGSEFNTGARITGFQILPGDSLAIFGDDQISILSGTSSADWQLDTHSNQMGAIEGTIQNMPTTIFASPRGISTLSASDNYGDFSGATISHRFAPTFERITRNTKLFSLVNRDSSQYRLINSNGHALYLTFASDSLVGAMEVDMKHNITAVGSIDDETNSLFFGTDDGWVHRLDQSNTFSGKSMDAFLEFPYFSHKSPRQKKRFKEVILDIKGDPFVDLRVTPTYDKGRYFHSESTPITADVIDGRAQPYNDNALTRFNRYFQAVAYTTGTGTDQSLTIAPNNSAPHEIDSITTHYTYRGQRR